MRAYDRNRAWIVVALLFMFMVINFADKAVVGIAAVPIMQELKLSLVFEKLTDMKRAGYTLLVVEQNAARALSVADRAYVLELGRNRLEGPGRALLADREVKRLYLGG